MTRWHEHIIWKGFNIQRIRWLYSSQN